MNQNSKAYITCFILSLSMGIFIVAVFFRGHTYYTSGDDVTPLSPAALYNFQPFFSNAKGGQVASIPSSLVSFIIFNIYANPFMFATQKYGEIASYIFYFTLGNFGLLSLIHNYYDLNNQDIKKTATAGLATLLFYNTNQGIGQVMGINSSMVPIFGVFPWILYLLYLDFKEKSAIKAFAYGLMAILLYYIFIANTYFIIVNIPLAFLLALFAVFLALFLRGQPTKIKILRLGQLVAILAIIAYPYIFGLIKVTAPAFASALTSKNIQLALGHYYVRGYQGDLVKTLTLTYTSNITTLPPSIYKYLGTAPYYNSHLITILGSTITLLVFTPLLLSKPKREPMFFYFTFLLTTAWFSAPYILPYYINFVSRIEILWSLNIPEAVFPYPLSISATLLVAYAATKILLEKKSRKIITTLIITLLVFSLALNAYPVSTKSGGGFSLPQPVYETSTIIGSSHIFNPRVMIAPSSFLYLWYNWSAYGDGQYVGAGFWDTLIKGDTFGYYQGYPPLVAFTTLYQANMSNPTLYANALKLLGINYVIYTNTSVQRTLTYGGLAAQIPTLTNEDLEQLNTTIASSSQSILLNYEGFTLYYYSNATLCYVPKQIVLSSQAENPISNATALSTIYRVLSLKNEWENTAVIYPNPQVQEFLDTTTDNTTLYYPYPIGQPAKIIQIKGISPEQFECIIKGVTKSILPIIVRYPYNSLGNYKNVNLKGENITLFPLAILPANYGSATLILFNVTREGNYTMNFNLKPPMDTIGYLYYYSEGIDIFVLILLTFTIIILKTRRLRISKYTNAQGL